MATGAISLHVIRVATDAERKAKIDQIASEVRQHGTPPGLPAPVKIDFEEGPILKEFKKRANLPSCADLYAIPHFRMVMLHETDTVRFVEGTAQFCIPQHSESKRQFSALIAIWADENNN